MQSLACLKASVLSPPRMRMKHGVYTRLIHNRLLAEQLSPDLFGRPGSFLNFHATKIF
jgi:hypothetical protein